MPDNVVQFSTDQEEALRLVDDARDMIRRGEMTAVVMVGATRDAQSFHSFFIPSGMEITALVGNLEIVKAQVLATLETEEENRTG